MATKISGWQVFAHAFIFLFAVVAVSSLNGGAKPVIYFNTPSPESEFLFT
ncbi:hypothetical protein [Adhaeribacter radiodurans]|uniref:Uncharacterized protein n=1 Tax=Adhaeribacter radiodurans TaxID=2745197 RepID=A0A7L7LA26_9BACT|nr:hypothetical protein [Adhaeribacter radiodurans]QMU29678.1 hypothetical protein HUW48_17305 [Adhaeribacter radiodurans]